MGSALRTTQSERGFSLIETMVAMGLLAGGMLVIAAAFLQGAMQLTGSDLDVLAREKAAEAIESVFTARDTRTIQWAQIRNVEGEGNAGGVFKDGPQPLTRAGADGLINTADDGPVESLARPGADGLLGTPDDTIQVLTDFTREVSIRDVTQSLRELRVIVRYRVGGATREYAISTLISSYA